MNAPFLLPGLDSERLPERPPAVPVRKPKTTATPQISEHEAELAAELAFVLRKQPRAKSPKANSRPAPARRETPPASGNGESLKERLDAVDWRDGRGLPPPASDMGSDIGEHLIVDSDAVEISTSSSGQSTAAWLKKARRDRQLARLSHAVSWAVTLLIGGTVFAIVSIMLFGPGRVMAALNKFPLM